MEKETVIVTRHAAFVEYLREIGAVPRDAFVIPHVTPERIRGRHVAGSLPLHLAALAASVIHVPLGLPPFLPVQRYVVRTVAQDEERGAGW